MKNGSLPTSYALVWLTLNNEISHDELVISATCLEDCENILETPIPVANKTNVKIKNNIEIPGNTTFTYAITVSFKNMNYAQDYNQDAIFMGTIGIIDAYGEMYNFVNAI